MSRDQLAVEREKREREKRIGKMERLVIPSEYSGEMIHVAKKLYDSILKKVHVTGVRPVGGAGGKVIIEYQPKRGGGRGVLELCDIGPAPIKI